MKLFILLIGAISLSFGVKFIYDARPIVKRYFGQKDKNEASTGLKVIGFALSILGGILIFISM